jgi:hypothetical protein
MPAKTGCCADSPVAGFYEQRADASRVSLPRGAEDAAVSSTRFGSLPERRQSSTPANMRSHSATDAVGALDYI